MTGRGDKSRRCTAHLAHILYFTPALALHTRTISHDALASEMLRLMGEGITSLEAQQHVQCLGLIKETTHCEAVK